jgi:hypothetical protein
MLPIHAFSSDQSSALTIEQIPAFQSSWEIAVMYGHMVRQISLPAKILILF